MAGKGKKAGRVGHIPSVSELRRKSGKAGQAHEKNVIGGEPPKIAPTDWSKYKRPEGFHRDEYGTWRVDKGMEKLGNASGRPGQNEKGKILPYEYGYHRIFGREAAQAYAKAKKDASPAMIRRLDEFQESGDVTQFLTYRTRTEHRERPRTKLAGYDTRGKVLFILFRYKDDRESLDGAIYAYFGVPYNVWRMVKRNTSTGRTINRVLNAYPYAEIRPALTD